MDVRKLTGMAIVFAVTAPMMITMAPPEMLALIDAGLIGMLYVVRRRRLARPRTDRRSRGPVTF